MVEIDETLVAHRKYNVGRAVRQQWLFGGVVRGSRPLQCFLELVPDRSAETLIGVLKRRVHPGCTIVSDGWRGYVGLEAEGFRHITVNHNENFVNPVNPVAHTQTIESLWSRLKDFFRANKLRNRVHLDDYIAEFMFREMSLDVFDSLMSVLEPVV